MKKFDSLDMAQLVRQVPGYTCGWVMWGNDGDHGLVRWKESCQFADQGKDVKEVPTTHQIPGADCGKHCVNTICCTHWNYVNRICHLKQLPSVEMETREIGGGDACGYILAHDRPCDSDASFILAIAIPILIIVIAALSALLYRAVYLNKVNTQQSDLSILNDGIRLICT